MGQEKIGYLKWYSEARGHGYISRPGKRDAYFNRVDVCYGHKHLTDGAKVQYVEKKSGKGYKAEDVKPFVENRLHRPETPEDLFMKRLFDWKI